MTPLEKVDQKRALARAMDASSLPWPPGVDAGKGDAPQQPAHQLMHRIFSAHKCKCQGSLSRPNVTGQLFYGALMELYSYFMDDDCKDHALTRISIINISVVGG